MKPARLPDDAGCRICSGVIPSVAPAVLDEWVHEAAAAVSIVFVESSKRAEAIAAALPLFSVALRGAARAPEIMLFPPAPDETDAESGRAFEIECDRTAVLTRLADFAEEEAAGARLVVFTTPEAFFAPVPRREEIRSHEIVLRKGDTVSFEDFKQRLATELNYDSEAVCEFPGQFAVRGGLIDVYPVNAQAPVRIDFFGDEIDDIRSYDPTSQLSQQAQDSVRIAVVPGDARITGHAMAEHIFGYFPESVNWFFDEPVQLESTFPSLFQVFERMEHPKPGFQTLFDQRSALGDRFTCLQEIDTDPRFAPDAAERISLLAETLDVHRDYPLDESFGRERFEAEQTARARFLAQVAQWSDAGETVVIVVPNEGEETRLREILDELDLSPALRARFVRGTLAHGFRWIGGESDLALSWRDHDRSHNTVVVSDSEIFGRLRTRPVGMRRRKLPNRKQVDQLLDFSELVDGDYLVHLSHGVCQFRGLSKMEIRGKSEEVISVEFAESVTLHVPLHESHLLTRYVGLTKTAPKLGKLGGNQWEKTRRAAEKATLDFAADLLKLHAMREESGGHAFTPDTVWQKEFEDAFTYQETPDQAQAIVETKQDMERGQPMDRLICGDVGFGKTEVAIRAAFKAVMDGYQVAMLVPTTILAQQHYLTFRDRMADFPVTVEMMSRFRDSGQQKEILKQLKDGRIDILVGTHRLLSKDVEFNKLGLLVIDEEHRFGVRHKERLKQIKTDVDVLTMSATPIPRTLYMALMGARDLSVIETPPEDRLPIRTIVKAYDTDLVRNAVRHELERGGQVFYLHNRVQTIDAVAQRLQELVPDARIAVGHGQMTEQRLERIMGQFVAGEHDILVCTTIIENGLDIPNCNTIIIEGADRFGLSQLYQLRGRVGRFKRQAYAYLLLHRHARMLDLARKRLTAMRQHNQLGAGFKIAMRDLELRGAGNLLGPQQSGHIAGVGFELYCQLLRQSISRLKGEPEAARLRATVNLDFISMGEGAFDRMGSDRGFDVLKDVELAEHRIEPAEAHIPRSYIDETRLRIDFYRRLAMADHLKQIEEIETALADRFGKLPRPVKTLLTVTRIRVRAEAAGIISVSSEGNRLKCLRASGKRDDFLMLGSRFPRLTGHTADLRLREIEQFLHRQRPNP